MMEEASSDLTSWYEESKAERRLQLLQDTILTFIKKAAKQHIKLYPGEMDVQEEYLSKFRNTPILKKLRTSAQNEVIDLLKETIKELQINTLSHEDLKSFDV